MTGYVARRLVGVVPLLFIVSFAIFGLATMIPADPVIGLAGGTRATPETIAHVRHKLRLDRPFLTQYGLWLGDAVRGDLGESYVKNTSVASEVANRFPVTLSMAVGAMVVTVLLGLPAGILAGTKPRSARDRTITFGTSAALAMPDFWLALVALSVFSIQHKILPARGYTAPAYSVTDWARHLVIPWFVMGLATSASLARQVRGALADALEQDYVRTAEAKGLRRRWIVGKHALKNASFAPVTVLGLQFAYMLGGTVVLERIFSIPGIGQYFFEALSQGDRPIVAGVTLVVALTFVVVNLLVDVLYAYLNPKVRLG